LTDNVLVLTGPRWFITQPAPYFDLIQEAVSEVLQTRIELKISEKKETKTPWMPEKTKPSQAELDFFAALLHKLREERFPIFPHLEDCRFLSLEGNIAYVAAPEVLLETLPRYLPKLVKIASSIAGKDIQFHFVRDISGSMPYPPPFFPTPDE
jgi:hypothetical protein